MFATSELYRGTFAYVPRKVNQMLLLVGCPRDKDVINQSKDVHSISSHMDISLWLV